MGRRKRIIVQETMRLDDSLKKKEESAQPKVAAIDEAPIDCCDECKHYDKRVTVVAPLPTTSREVTRHSCVRFPTSVLKQAHEICGEFQRKV